MLSRTPRLWLSLVVVVGVSACASSGGDRAPATGVASRLLPFLRSPLEGYGGEVTAEWGAELRRAHRALVEESALEVARTAGRALASRFPALLPAEVLLAQTDFVAGGYDAVVDRLEPLLLDHEGYVAGQILLGRAAELVEEPVIAYRAYLGAGGDPLAIERGDAVREAATQTLAVEAAALLDRGRLSEARSLVSRLESWAPASRAALGARLQLARAEGDQSAELGAVRGLLDLEPGRRDWAERRAELELEIGDPKTGVDLYQELLARHPDDPMLADRLASAKFRWRLEMLPRDVVSILGPTAISRGDFATLLYWLVPGARSARSRGGTIASDVPLEHPQREAILRILNLGLMEVADRTLHQFAPDREITRAEALRSLAGWLSSETRCAAPLGAARTTSDPGVCEVAARCRLIGESAECLPGAALTGMDAREVIRRALDLVSGER